ncbi:hypothetical protein KR018_009242, partial [Drosophila ironensis]
AALLVVACAVNAAPVAEPDSSIDFPASRQLVQAEDPEQAHNSSADSSDDEEKEDSHKVADKTQEDDDDTEEDDDDDDTDKEDDDDDDDDSLIRRRREAETTEEPAEEAATETPAEADKDQKVEASSAAAPTRKPVLVLIRDALKKVTTDLPTAQVANNALQYFQQFEHFIQQAIEEVIGDDDDEEETPVTVIPGQEAATEGGDIKKPEEEGVTAETPVVDAPVEKETTEPVKVVEPMASTSAPLSNAV